jgi:hypothetical protein
MTTPKRPASDMSGTDDYAQLEAERLSKRPNTSAEVAESSTYAVVSTLAATAQAQAQAQDVKQQQQPGVVVVISSKWPKRPAAPITTTRKKAAAGGKRNTAQCSKHHQKDASDDDDDDEGEGEKDDGETNMILSIQKGGPSTEAGKRLYAVLLLLLGMDAGLDASDATNTITDPDGATEGTELPAFKRALKSAWDWAIATAAKGEEEEEEEEEEGSADTREQRSASELRKLAKSPTENMGGLFRHLFDLHGTEAARKESAAAPSIVTQSFVTVMVVKANTRVLFV